MRHFITLSAASLIGLAIGACSADQPVPDPSPPPAQVEPPQRPKAFWNQEEYDRAVHTIFQDRQTDFTLSVQTPQGLADQAHTALLHRHAVEDKFNDHPLKLDPQGKATQAALAYPASMLIVELGDDIMASDDESQGNVVAIEETLRLDWFQPGKHFKQVDVSVHTALYDARASTSAGELAQVALKLPPGATIQSVYAGLGRLVGAELGPNKQSQIFAAQTTDGTTTITADLKAFFGQYLDNHSTAPKPGELYNFTGSVTLDAPDGTFTQLADPQRQDPPFVFGDYDGKVSTQNGDPYLDIPSTTPHTTVTLRFSAKVKLTQAMLTP